jgi:hypothetical protein
MPVDIVSMKTPGIESVLIARIVVLAPPMCRASQYCVFAAIVRETALDFSPTLAAESVVLTTSGDPVGYPSASDA